MDSIILEKLETAERMCFQFRRDQIMTHDDLSIALDLFSDSEERGIQCTTLENLYLSFSYRARLIRMLTIRIPINNSTREIRNRRRMCF